MLKWDMVVGGGRRLRAAAGFSRSASRLLAPKRDRSARRPGFAPLRGGGARAVPRRLDPTGSRRASRPLGVAHSLPPPPPAAFGDWPASRTNGGPPAPASPARGGARLPRGARSRPALTPPRRGGPSSGPGRPASGRGAPGGRPAAWCSRQLPGLGCCARGRGRRGGRHAFPRAGPLLTGSPRLPRPQARRVRTGPRHLLQEALGAASEPRCQR